MRIEDFNKNFMVYGFNAFRMSIVITLEVEVEGTEFSNVKFA